MLESAGQGGGGVAAVGLQARLLGLRRRRVRHARRPARRRRFQEERPPPPPPGTSTCCRPKARANPLIPDPESLTPRDSRPNLRESGSGPEQIRDQRNLRVMTAPSATTLRPSDTETPSRKSVQLCALPGDSVRLSCINSCCNKDLMPCESLAGGGERGAGRLVACGVCRLPRLSQTARRAAARRAGHAARRRRGGRTDRHCPQPPASCRASSRRSR